MTTIKYTFELLNNFCKENKIKLIKNYSNEKINREIKIDGLCITCNENFSRTFRLLFKYNGYCVECINKIKYNKIKLKHQERNTKIDFERSLSSHIKSKYFSEKNTDEYNNKINTNFIPLGTNKKYIFNCDKCPHDFEISIEKLSIGRWCPYCCIPQKKLCGKNKEICKDCFEKSFASHEKSKFWSNDNEKTPEFVFKLGDTEVKFNCDCGHTFISVIKNITKLDCWCPYCCIPSQKRCDNIECKLCSSNSFASHEKSKFWSIENNVSPRDIAKSTSDKYIFFCDICDHKFEQSINSIYSGSFCPYCSHNMLCNNDNCNFCFLNSFASCEKSKFWSNKNKLKPRELFINSNKYFIFNCECGHEIEKSLGSIKDSWCSYCCNPPLKLCDDNNCINCYNNSFESHEKSNFWSNKNELKPRQIFKHTAKKYIFDCNKCKNDFLKNISSITGNKMGWCPHCVNKTETKLYEKLLPFYNNLQQQYKAEWCKNKTFLPFDFCIIEYNIIIELDGIQHFIQVCNWSSPEKTQENDKYKMKCANDNNFSVIRILQEDVFYDTFNWLDELKDNIEKIKNENIIQNIFICKNNEYDIFNTK